MVEKGEAPGVEVAFDAYQVFLVDRRVLTNQLARHPPILRQYQQTGRVNVEPAGRCQSLQTRRMEDRRAGRTVLRVRLDQCHRRREAGLWLTGDIAHRLVQQNRHPALLVRLRLLVKHNHRSRIRTGTEFADPSPINEDPATGNVLVGIAARAKATLGHQLGNTYARRADGFRRGSSRQRRRRCRRKTARCGAPWWRRSELDRGPRIAESRNSDRPGPGPPVTDRRATATDCNVGQRCGG